jgi:protein TonB
MTASPITAGPNIRPFSALASGVRLIAALGIAAAVTAGLFILMRTLIWVEDPVPADPVERPVVQLSFTVDEFEFVRTPPPDRPDETRIPPPITPLRVDPSEAPGESPLTRPVQPVEVEADLDTMRAVVMPPPPLEFRARPDYPRRELDRGIEGSCVIRYDILANGRTTNIQPLQCDSNGFARASVDAVAQWRHAVANGRAPDEVVRRGVETRLDYMLEG